MTLFATGGAGFTSSSWLREHRARSDEAVVNLNALTRAGGARNLARLRRDARHHFVHGVCGPGHYPRDAVNPAKLLDTGWRAAYRFDVALRDTLSALRRG